ncbi:MAG: phosphotransferase [Novosphingobium sp.]|nr:phosphotransferase [Novosphingobium sp.]
MNVTANPAVDPAHRFNEPALSAYLAKHLPGFGSEVAVTQFQGGQSNPTYRIDTSAGSCVLRKRPAGKLLPKAHQIDREFAFMEALAGTVPVPKMLHFCEDEVVIGQSFYVMEHIEGRMMPDARLPGAGKKERRQLCFEMMRVLARLHQADAEALGLSGFGRSGGYVARQFALWTRQYAAAKFEENDDMQKVIPWLEARLPAREETAIIHGDYRSHNILFAPTGPKIAAVLDWEVATLGNPLSDVAYACLPYYMTNDDLKGFQGEDPDALGIPPEQEMVATYCREAGRPELPDWHFFLVFSLFRSAAIRAGVYRRGLDGTAASAEGALKSGIGYRGAAAAAWRIAQSPR